ncbi:MAG: tRNA lysidine(34) synthetase TilS [Spirochaetales bacterium]|nr:tRNA lysidine(34) synthetase TilS [Spirochaetales bacterium]
MSSIEKRLTEEVLLFLKHNQLEAGTMCLIALSGGPDSTALLRSLVAIRDKLSLQLGAAYVNHGLRDREELDREDRFVRNLTAQYNIPLFEKKIRFGEISAISSREKRSTEDVAREYRYRFFESVLGQYGKASLLLGHNLDDQIETIITRFFQGNGPAGLKGIPHSNKHILRPLIHIRKAEILSYLTEIGQDWCADPSNGENEFLRNRVRNQLIPVIEDIFPGLEKAMLKQEKTFNDLDLLFEEVSSGKSLILDKNTASLCLSDFNDCNSFVRKKILYKFFDHLFSGDEKGFRLPSGFFNSLTEGNIIPGRIYARAYGLVVEAQPERLVMKRDPGLEMGFFSILSENSEIQVNRYRITLNSRRGIPLFLTDGSPVFFRSSIDGDVIETDQGVRKLKEIYRQWGLDRSLRYSVPLVEDSSGIAAVLGELEGFKNIHRKKKMNASEKFNILYLEVGKE